MSGGSFGGGTGARLDPYLVEDRLDLMAIGSYVDKFYKQTENIDLSSTSYTPTNFSGGGYDGNNLTISNFNLTGTSNDCGIFDYVDSVEYIKNLNLTEVYFDIEKRYTGILCRYIYADVDIIIENIKIDGTIRNIESVSYLGSLFGEMYLLTENVIIKDCTSELTLNLTYIQSEVGGLFGNINGNPNSETAQVLIKNCHTELTLTSIYMYNDKFGGIAGNIDIYAGITITNCTAKIDGDIDGLDDIGGFIGYFGCYSSQDVLIEKCYSALNGYFMNSETYGDTYVSYVGGFIGFFSYGGGGNCSIENCYSTGNMNLKVDHNTNGSGVAGFIGLESTRYDLLTMENCYTNVDMTNVSVADESTIISSDIGGFTCSNYTGMLTINNCYYNYELVNYENSLGDRRTTSQMTIPYETSTTYIDWDFTEIWAIEVGVNDGYPFFLPPPHWEIIRSLQTYDSSYEFVRRRCNYYYTLESSTVVNKRIRKLKHLTR